VSSHAQLLSRPNFYVHAPSRTDPSAAPEGMDSIMVLLPVASMQQVESGEWAGSKRLGSTGVEAALRSVRLHMRNPTG
jgi:phytoene dehydrogenase-like protein